VTLRDIRRRYLDAAEVERVSQLELLDEVEELELVLSHYAVSWGATGCGTWGLKERVSGSQAG
jgi:[phosphatase 2A protein]-leucine-carboxy methyltransferase